MTHLRRRRNRHAFLPPAFALASRDLRQGMKPAQQESARDRPCWETRVGNARRTVERPGQVRSAARVSVARRVHDLAGLRSAPPANSAEENACLHQQELLPAPKPTLKPRRLTVGCGSTDTHGVDVHYLRLHGRWLQYPGFVIGRHVRIELGEGRMIIEAGAVRVD